MLIVLGDETDLRVQGLCPALHRQRLPYIVLNNACFPYTLQLTQSIDDSGQDVLFLPGEGVSVPANEIRAVYYCCQYPFVLRPDDPAEIGDTVYQNINSAFWSFFYGLAERDCLFVNPIKPADHHNYKTDVLRCLKAAGVRVPATTVTNRPEAVVAFYEQHARCIFKPPWGQAFTEELLPKHLKPDMLARLANSPTMLQEYVAGQEIRLYVIGEAVFGVRVISDALDINEDAYTLRQAFEPDEAMVALARRVAQVTGLVFTAIDMRQTPDGELVVFEANSSPDFTADEAQAGHPLSDCLARLLARVD